MDSHDHCNSPGGKSHVCTKCGWSYPNPHPSAKNRRAHKKVCGTIKGFELIDSVNAKQNLDLQEEHCLEDDPKTPSPRVVITADERIGDVSEEDVFTDAVCEFSSSLVSDSFKEKEKTATKCVAKNPSETQQCDDSTMDSMMKSSEVVQESCEVLPMEVREKCNVPSSVAVAFDNQQGGERSIASESPIKSIQEAQVTDGGDTISNAVLEAERKGNLPDESESKLASALGKKEDTSNSSWNDEVIYSDVEGPQGFVLEASSMTHPGEADSIGSQNVPVYTSPMKANAAQLISTSHSVPDDIPSVENADVHGNNGHEEYEVNLFRPETPKEERCETDTLTQAKNIGIQPEGFNIETEAPLSDKLPFEDKIERQVQTGNLTESTIDPEDRKMKAEKGESSFGSAQETSESESLRVSQPAVDPIVVDWNADVSHAASKTGIVDLTSHESELIQADAVGEEGNSPKNQPSSESSFGAENYVSPVSVVFEGDYASDQRKSSTKTPKNHVLQIGAEACQSNGEAHRETSKAGLDASDQVSVVFEGDDAKDQIKHSTETSENIQIGAEACESNDEAHRESSKGRLDASNQVSVVFKGDDANDQIEHSTETSENIQIGAEECESNAEARKESCNGRLEEESSFIKETITKEYPLSHPDSIDTASDESFKSANQKSLESGRTEYHKIVGGLGVIQGNEIDGNSRFYAEVPVTIESNDHRDFGRLQNLSEAHIRSLVSSPLVNRNNSSQAFESNLGSVSGLSGGYNKPEHGFQNQEITLEKTTSWSSTKEQHVPLKNLLNEARSPKLQLEATDHHENNSIQRVSSILGQETSPEDGRWPETREVSQEWHSPAKYPVGLKREERKVKGRPFWVPFVCCSSVK